MMTRPSRANVEAASEFSPVPVGDSRLRLGAVVLIVRVVFVEAERLTWAGFSEQLGRSTAVPWP